MDDVHKSVLLDETIEYLNCHQDGIYLDGTLGRGGHTAALLNKIDEQGLVIGIDRDYDAIKAVEKKLARNNLKLVHGNFVDIPQLLDQLGIELVDGMIFDLGVSSPHFDLPERGFSYRYEGPLDMRMNQQQELSAEIIINNYSEEELTTIIKEYGEERWASRIAQFIVEARQRRPIKTTLELVDIIKNAIPAAARRGGGHPARRTFQALRIATNDELNQLERMIRNSVSRLKPGGRICIISFHSLEDRIVKNTFRQLAKECICPPDFPICVCDHQQVLKLITRKPIQPGKEELKLNPRSRSAKLRVAEKVLN